MLLSFSLCFMGTAWPYTARAQSAEEAREQLLEGFDELQRVLEATRSELDPTRADVDELAFELAFEEPEAIARWVQQNIAFEAYPGLLRGPTGTLAAGAGNALDQAVLLARLMNDAGYQADVVRARLTDEAALALVETIRTDRAAGADERAGAAWSPEAAAETLGLTEDQLADLEATADARLAELHAQTESVAQDLTERLRAAGVTTEGASVRSMLAQEAQDYFFVQWRISEGDAWQDAHPAFAADGPTDADYDVVESLQGAVPEALQHRVRIQLFVEQKLGDSLEARPVTEAWERPAANLVAEPVRVASRADGFSRAEDPGDDASVLEATNFFLPTFGDELAPGGQAFDLQGNVVPPDAAASAAAGLFQELGEQTGRAAGALGGLGSDDPPDAEFVALSAHWIEYTVIEPGGEETTHRRMILDRLGADRRASGDLELTPMTDMEMFEALQTSHTVMVAAGRFRDAYLAWHNVRLQLQAHVLLDGVLESRLDAQRTPAVSSELAQTEATLGYLLTHSLYDAYEPTGAASYRAGAAITVLARSYDGSNALSDIVTANERVVDASGAAAWGEAIRSGVWQTLVEGMPLERAGAAVHTPVSALRDAMSAGIEVTVLRTGDGDSVTALDLPAAARAGIMEDLAAGYAVVTPVALPDPGAMAGWWRIDPETGASLGRGGDGRGQGFVEYLTTFEVSISITAAFAVYGASECMEIEDAAEAGCCLIDNVAYAGLGVAIGAALAGVWAALAIFAVMDVGYNLAGAAGLLPSICSRLTEGDPWEPEIVGA